MTKDAVGTRFNTVLFKLSGELLGGDEGRGIDAIQLDRVSEELATLATSGIRTAVVIGGGNYFRGGHRSQLSISTERGHQLGMLFTIANSMVLEQGIVNKGVDAVVQSSIRIQSVVESFNLNTCKAHLDTGRVVIFAGGTGHSHFSTDTAASLRAVQIGADILLKATKVNGVYDSDPMKNATATRFEKLDHSEVLEKNLAFMDATSIALCREHNLAIRVFDASIRGGMIRAGMGKQIGSLVSMEEQDD